METKKPEINNKELHRIATTVLIYKPDFTYLITKRAMHKKMMPGKWHIPGGGLTTDDYVHGPSSTEGAKQWYGALQNTMIREVKEEVDLKIGKPEFLLDLTAIRPDGTPLLVLSYFAPYVSGEVKLDEDSTDSAWVTLIEAKKYDLIDGIWDEIREVDEILKSRMK